MKRVTVACESCKKARKKCSGDIPCEACTKNNIECVFDQDKDGRRGRKRTLDQLYSKADALDTLLTSLKSFDDQSMKDLINVVRDGASIDEIVQHTRLVLEKNEAREKSRSRVRRTVLDIASLVDEPPIQVPAKPWTDVTADDNAVSHLISIFFTWHHPGYSSVDQDIFLREMKAKSLSTQFCSPFLVNSMLTIACMYTDHASAFQDPLDPSTRGLHYLTEAMRLGTLEQGNVTLTNLQAMPALMSGLVALGRDRAALSYTSHSITLSMELASDVKKQLKRGVGHYNKPEFIRSYALAQWGAFMIQTEVAIAWSKPFVLQKLAEKLPYAGKDLDVPKLWHPYPKKHPEASYSPRIVINERIKIYEIAVALQPVLVSGSPQDSPSPGYAVLDPDLKISCLHDIEQKLYLWKQALPAEACVEYTDGSVPPDPLTDLHLVYHSFRICTASQLLRVTGIAQADQERAEENIIDSCQSIASIFEWRQNTVGLLDFGIYTPHAATLSAYGLLEYMMRDGIVQTFQVIIVALFAVARRWTLIRGVLRMIWMELQQRHLDHLLDDTTLNLFKLSAVVAWSPEDHRVIVKCAYPNYAAIRERGHGLSEMGELLEEYSKLQVHEATPNDTGL